MAMGIGGGMPVMRAPGMRAPGGLRMPRQLRPPAPKPIRVAPDPGLGQQPLGKPLALPPMTPVKVALKARMGSAVTPALATLSSGAGHTSGSWGGTNSKEGRLREAPHHTPPGHKPRGKYRVPGAGVVTGPGRVVPA
jgi:hypothetical protein